MLSILTLVVIFVGRSLALLPIDPFVFNYTLSTMAQQDRFSVEQAPDFSAYADQTAPGYQISLYQDGCAVSGFSYMTVSFWNNFNGDILLRGNTPMEILNGVPKFRVNHLTATLKPGESISIMIPFHEDLSAVKGNLVVYSYVFSSTQHLGTPLIGNLMVVVDTKDRSLCLRGKTAFDTIFNTMVKPYSVYGVRKLYVENPLALPHIIQAPDSQYPCIGFDWYEYTSGEWGLYLVYKSANGENREPVQFRSYEDANLRLIALGLGAGYTKNGNGFEFGPITASGEMKFDNTRNYWILIQAEQVWHQSGSIPRNNHFMTIPANGGFLVVDIRRPSLGLQQQQILSV